MKKTLLISITLTINSLASAALKPLVVEFLTTNVKIRSNQLQDEIENNNLLAFESVFDAKKSNPTGLFSFQSQETKESGFSATFSKYLQTGTEFSYAQHITKLDLSKWNVTTPSELGDTPYSTYSLLSVKQYLWADSFGRSFRASYEMTKSLKEANIINLKFSDQLALYEFISDYINAKKIKTFLNLSKFARKRALIRRNLVARKLRDGVSRKIDLYQADLSLLAQSENIEVSQDLYISSEEKLSKKIQRVIKLEEVSAYNLGEINLINKIKGSIDESLSLKSLIKYRDVANFDYKNAKYSHAPSVYLQASLKTNTFNSELSTALSDSYPGGDNKETTVTLTMDIPLGMNATSSAKQIKKAELLKSELSIINMKRALDIENKLIDKRLIIQNKNANSALKRLDLAKRSLKEHNRLYNLGKIDLIQVLSAEEAVSDTEKSLATYLSDYEQLVLKQALIKGKVTFFVKEFVEK